MKNDIHDLGLVLDSRVKLILIESWDERRVLQTLSGLAVRRGLGMYCWSVSEGLQHLGFGGEALPDSEDPVAALRLVKADRQHHLYVFCDLHAHLADNPLLVRLLKDVALAEELHKPTLVLVSHAFKLPAEVQRLAARFNLALPSEDELLALVREEAQRWSEQNRNARVRTDNRTLQQVVKNLRGLSHAEARALARNLIVDDGAITQDDLPELNRTKFQLLDMEGVLSFESETARFAEVGGLGNLKRWLGERQQAFLQGGMADSPRGMLLVGVQGGGKSLAAKAVAGLWGLPLLRLDFACLYNKFFGETERNLREALKLAEQMAPCVLWMDEIEKGSSRFPGEGGLDFQKEVFRVPKSIGHALDHLDAVVNTLKDAGMHVEVSTGKDASGVFAQVASEALQRREAALASMSQPGSPASPTLSYAGGVPDILQGILEYIDRSQRLVRCEQFL